MAPVSDTKFKVLFVVVFVLTDDAVDNVELPNPLSVSYSNWQDSEVESVLTEPFKVAIHGEVELIEVAAKVETTIADDAVTAAERFDVVKVVGEPDKLLSSTLSSSEA